MQSFRERVEEQIKDINARAAKGPFFGIFTELHNEAYHGSEGVSHSGLGAIDESPASYREWKLNPPEETKALRDGKRFHTCLLEPDLFSKMYRVKPEREKRSKEDKAWWVEFEKELAESGQVLATQEEMDLCFRMQDSLLKNQLVRRALIGAKEVSAWAQEPNTGVLVKARTDIINAAGVIVDLKTTDDCSEEEFARSVAKYKYHRQNIFHMNVINMALEKCGPLMVEGKEVKQVRDPIILAVEKRPPFNWEMYVMHIDDLQVGFDEYVKALEVYAACLKTDTWPTRGGVIKELRLPKYYKRPEVEL